MLEAPAHNGSAHDSYAIFTNSSMYTHNPQRPQPMPPAHPPKGPDPVRSTTAPKSLEPEAGSSCPCCLFKLTHSYFWHYHLMLRTGTLHQVQLLSNLICSACRCSMSKRRSCSVPQPASLCPSVLMWTAMMMAGRQH